MDRRKRVGVMGGTFDPVHIVHLILAENALKQFDLDEILMLPNGDPPHKTGKKITPASHRIAMLRLASEGVAYFRVDDMELRRAGYSYTSVTLKELREAHPDTDYYFIMGGDSVFQIETWHRPEEVMSQCVILAAIRDQVSMADFKAQIVRLKEKYDADIRIIDLPDMMLSSTEIRRRIREGRSVRFMTPDPVCDYIKEHHLYLPEANTEEGEV